MVDCEDCCVGNTGNSSIWLGNVSVVELVGPGIVWRSGDNVLAGPGSVSLVEDTVLGIRQERSSRGRSLGSLLAPPLGNDDPGRPGAFSPKDEGQVVLPGAGFRLGEGFRHFKRLRGLFA